MNPGAIPLALYLHFPWCVSKCPYCDFNSFAVGSGGDGKLERFAEDRYVAALLADIGAQRERFQIDRPIVSIFLGGGTPSLFAPASIARVLDFVRDAFQLAPDAEVTMEANPGTLEHGRFAAYRDAGINRVSLGVQSFDDQQLNRLGRIHCADDARRAADELHAAELTNFNLDLMYGLPEQTEAEAAADVAAALALDPAHLSHYQLTMEPGTPFAADPPRLPDDERIVAMLARCQALLANAELERYEVSGYARAGRQCRHNVNYWAFGDYLGAGAGAHGKLTTAAGIVRTTQAREPRRYMTSAATALVQTSVPSSELSFEFMLNALRLLGGFTPELFEARTGLSWLQVSENWRQGVAKGLLETAADGCCRATARGLDFLNDALLTFLASERPAVSTRF